MQTFLQPSITHSRLVTEKTLYLFDQSKMTVGINTCEIAFTSRYIQKLTCCALVDREFNASQI
jgi:hypothetical protein